MSGTPIKGKEDGVLLVLAPAAVSNWSAQSKSYRTTHTVGLFIIFYIMILQKLNRTFARNVFFVSFVFFFFFARAMLKCRQARNGSKLI